MGANRRKNKSIVKTCALRQVFAGTVNAQFPRSYLVPNLDSARLSIPLCDIQMNNSFAEGHILLGFTKCGEYLLSYCKELQDISFGIPTYKYTLHWWRFRMRRPLQKVCRVSLFVGQVFSEDHLLIVCHTLKDNRILVHGYAYPALRDEQCKQCYITICPSPPGNSSTSYDDTWVVHLKYNLLPPFPRFTPHIQLKLQDTVILNTVDSILAITVSPRPTPKTTNPKGSHEMCAENTRTLNADKSKAVCVNDDVETHSRSDTFPSKAFSQASSVSVKEVAGNELCRKESEEFQDDTVTCVQKTKTGEAVSTDKIIPTELDVTFKDAFNNGDTLQNSSSCTCCNPNNSTLNCDCPKFINSSHNIDKNSIRYDVNANGVNINESVKNEEDPNKTPKYSHLSSFSHRTFSIGTESEMVEVSATSTIIDGTSYHDIQINTITDVPYTLLEWSRDNIYKKDHLTPCIHTRVVSLDVEGYINEALNTADELKGKYWSLRNYNTLVVDVCEGSQCVIVHIAIKLLVQDNIEKITKQENSSLSLLLTWRVDTGEVQTLSISPLTKTMAKTDNEIFNEGCKLVTQLLRKYFVPSGLSAVQAFSNRSVFSQKTLEVIKHPFQPIAIVL